MEPEIKKGTQEFKVAWEAFLFEEPVSPKLGGPLFELGRQRAIRNAEIFFKILLEEQQQKGERMAMPIPRDVLWADLPEPRKPFHPPADFVLTTDSFPVIKLTGADLEALVQEHAKQRLEQLLKQGRE